MTKFPKQNVIEFRNSCSLQSALSVVGVSAMNEKHERIANFIESNKITIHVINVMTALSYGPQSLDVLSRQASSESQEAASRGIGEASSVDESRAAILSMLEAGLVFEMSIEMIERIVAVLDSKPAYGPVDGLPAFGSIDFSEKGAMLWESYESKVLMRKKRDYWVQANEYQDASCKIFICAYDKKEAVRLMESTLEQDDNPCVFATHVGPFAIGPWRDRWWRLPVSKGFVIEMIGVIRNEIER